MTLLDPPLCWISNETTGGGSEPTRTRYRAVMSGWDAAEVERAPICPYCGVTALPRDPSNVIDSVFVCENPDCDAYEDPV